MLGRGNKLVIPRSEDYAVKVCGRSRGVISGVMLAHIGGATDKLRIDVSR